MCAPRSRSRFSFALLRSHSDCVTSITSRTALSPPVHMLAVTSGCGRGRVHAALPLLLGPPAELQQWMEYMLTSSILMKWLATNLTCIRNKEAAASGIAQLHHQLLRASEPATIGTEQAPTCRFPPNIFLLSPASFCILFLAPDGLLIGDLEAVVVVIIQCRRPRRRRRPCCGARTRRRRRPPGCIWARRRRQIRLVAGHLVMPVCEPPNA